MSVEIAGFLVFATAQVATPGPANMVLLATGARFGLRAALPFVAGVVLGKQAIIWPVGFGLIGLAAQVPWLFGLLKWAAVAYILWLAWRIALMRLNPGQGSARAPGFAAGLAVHPVNPKAWAMIVTGFTSFVDPGTHALLATFFIAISLMGCQVVLHPLWAWGGARLAQSAAGQKYERALMVSLASLTALSVVYVLFTGVST